METPPELVIPVLYLCFLLLGVMIFIKIDDSYLASTPLYARILILFVIGVISLGLCALIVA